MSLQIIENPGGIIFYRYITDDLFHLRELVKRRTHGSRVFYNSPEIN
ncbi:MAG: hypothetical protein ABIN94_16790 [Ferruginibacter sp.]